MHGTGSCTWQPAVITGDDYVIGTNSSVRTVATGSRSGIGVAGPSDQLVTKVSQTATSSSISKDGAPRSIKLQFTGSAASIATAGASTCTGDASASTRFSFEFTLNAPLWATLSYSTSPGASATVQLNGISRGAGAVVYGRQSKASASSTVLLPADHYSGDLTALTFLEDRQTTAAVSTAGSMGITFASLGSAASGPSGKAQSYAALGSARSCSTGTLAAKITTNKTRAKAIRSVKFAVNGKTVKTLKGRAVKRGLSLKLKLSATKQASVTTTVKLKSGSTRTAKAVYRACA